MALINPPSRMRTISRVQGELTGSPQGRTPRFAAVRTTSDCAPHRSAPVMDNSARSLPARRQTSGSRPEANARRAWVRYLHAVTTRSLPWPRSVLLTHSAERFLQPQVVAWHADEVFTSDDASLNPTEFAKRSLGIVVLPATANMLASTALDWLPHQRRPRCWPAIGQRSSSRP